MPIEKKIIQILLVETGQIKKTDLASFLHIEKNIIEESLPEIRNLISILDLKLIENKTSLEICVNEEISNLINANKLDDLKTQLSESSLQTLAIIMYKQKATAAEINFVRGVDSARSVKNLLTRGIIERIEENNKKYYFPTTETLRYLNLEMVENLDSFTEISDKLNILIQG